jgi:hypothetical protein
MLAYSSVDILRDLSTQKVRVLVRNVYLGVQ